jgi:hypothetical protein
MEAGVPQCTGALHGVKLLVLQHGHVIKAVEIDATPAVASVAA